MSPVERAFVPGRVARARADARSTSAARVLRELASKSGPIVAGPWLAGPELELLYWLPLLNWLTRDGGVDPARVIAVSAGGADNWYASVAGQYVDAYDHVTPKEVDDGNVERRLFARARAVARSRRVAWLRPSLVDDLLGPRWRWGGGARAVTAHMLPLPLPDDGREQLVSGEPYVLLRFAYGPSFPSTPENRVFLDRLARKLKRQSRLVLLRSGAAGDQLRVVDRDRVEIAGMPIEPRERVAIQTHLVRHAEAYLATYGGISHVGPFVGTPTIAFYSRAAMNPLQLEDMERVSRQLSAGHGRLFRATHVDHLVLDEQG